MLKVALRTSTALFSIVAALPAVAQIPAPSPSATGEQAPATPAAPDSSTVTTATPTAPADSNGLQDIVVTAQRRSQSSQRVPVSVAAFDPQKLASTSAASTSDLPLLVPGLTIQRGGGGSESIFIRGVGNGGTVLKYVDGILQVYGGTPTVFNNLAALEVDKGPQSTLFGRNATGGVIQFNTKDPTSKPTLDVTLGYSNFNTFTGSGYASTAITPTLKTDIGIYYNDQKDGWGKNLATGHDVYNGKDFAVRSKTVWEPSSSFKATLTFDYKYLRTAVGNAVRPAKGIPFLYNEITGTTFTVPGKYDVNTDYDPYGTQRTGIVGLRLEDDLGPFRALSLTSYQRNTSFLHLDYDGTTIPFFNIDRTDQGRAWTQEFQLLSQPSSPVQWVAGLYYLSNDSNMSPFAFKGLGASAVFGAPDGEPFKIYADSGLTSYAAFGQATIPIFSHTKMTFGGRYTIDKVSIEGFTESGDTIVAGSQGGASKTFHRGTFRADIQQDFSSQIHGYFSFNRGYNAGGYNAVQPGGFSPANISVVNPETINAYEVGLKTQLLDNKLRFNIAAFQYDYSNLQQQVYESGGLATINAAAARIRGIDIDFEARPIRSITISGGFGYLSSKFTKYPNAPIYSYAANGALISTAGDAAGNYTVSAPKFGYNVAVRHSLETNAGEFASSVTMTYSSKWYADASNNFAEPKHYLVNLTETWTLKDRKTSITAFAKNLGNVYYDQGINLLTPVGAFSEPGAPRTFGFSVTRHF